MSSDKISRHDSDVKDPVEAHDDVKKPSTPEERQARLKAAMAEDPGLSGWNARAIKVRATRMCKAGDRRTQATCARTVLLDRPLHYLLQR